MGGTEIQLMVAVDFTASNGHPKDRQSLHYMQPGYPNQYQSALQAVGAVLEPYDADNMIPAFGFGGKDMYGKVHHCFNLNGNPNDPDCKGIAGVLGAYNKAIQNWTLSGPTLFSEIINTAVGLSLEPQTKTNQHYSILLLITDGVLNDVQKTIDSIVAATNHPLSIIIVGVGSADFTTMDVLDADDEPLIDSRGVRMQADIVQFVPFNQFKHNTHLLAKEVLEEVPDQLTGYFDRKNIKPMPQRKLGRSDSYGSLHSNEQGYQQKRQPRMINQPKARQQPGGAGVGVFKPAPPTYAQQEKFHRVGKKDGMKPPKRLFISIIQRKQRTGHFRRIFNSLHGVMGTCL
eukprot:UN29781